MSNPAQHEEAGDRRLAILARVLESFTATLDLDEVLLRIVNTALEEFVADRSWIMHPASLTAETARVVYEVTRPGWEGAFHRGQRLPLHESRELLRRALENPRPIVSRAEDPDVDAELWDRFSIRSQLAQILQPESGEPWAFGLHQCSHQREWTEGEIQLFSDIGRYATIALNNALLHRRALSEAATISAIIDHIPEAVAIYGPDGELRRINAAGRRHLQFAFQSAAAPFGGSESEEVVVTDPGTGTRRTLKVKSSPVIDSEGTLLGSVVIANDITPERERIGREARRRNRAECLASLGVDLFAESSAPIDLSDSAAMISTVTGANAEFYLHQSDSDELLLAGAHFLRSSGRRYREYLEAHPLRDGEGLPGVVFRSGRPLLMRKVAPQHLEAHARNDTERELIRSLGLSTILAFPIESYGERIGVLVLSRAEGEAFDDEDQLFAEAVCDRIGAAIRIHRLARMAQEGHRSAEDLARREAEARARLEAVIDSAPVAIAVVSTEELRFESANPPWGEHASRFGRVSAETSLVGLRVADVMPGLERALRQVAETGETLLDEALEIRREGEVWYVRQVIAPVRGRVAGTPQSVTILQQDVTEQVRASREIEALAQIMEERSARLASILGSMTDALLVYDASGRVVDVNPAALAMFGLGSRSEAITRGSLVDLHLRYPDGTPIRPDEMPYVRALQGEVVPDYLAIGRHLISGKDLDLSIAAAPIESNVIVGAVLVIRDITALQELDRKKDEFLSVASHELRTPLTTIRGYVQLLVQTVGRLDEAEQRTYLTAASGEIDRMVGLITELLDVSRIETRRLQVVPQEIRWVEFVSRRVEAFRVQNPDRQIALDAPSEEIVLHADADRMRQVLDNLLSNALKYSPDERPVEVGVWVREKQVVTSFRDYGIGVPKEEIPRLFDRFHRARNVSSRYYGGLGLGLYIARAIIEAHDGTIEVWSAEGEGSRFSVVLPIR
jgi:PAS domain S-box-containing protein